MQGYPKFVVGQFTLLINNTLFYSRLLQIKTKKTKLLKIYQKSADPLQTIKTEPDVFQASRPQTTTLLSYQQLLSLKRLKDLITTVKMWDCH